MMDGALLPVIFQLLDCKQTNLLNKLSVTWQQKKLQSFYLRTAEVGNSSEVIKKLWLYIPVHYDLLVFWKFIKMRK